MEENNIKEMTKKVLTSGNNKEHKQNLINVFDNILKSDNLLIENNIKSFIAKYAIGSHTIHYMDLIKKIATEQSITNTEFVKHPTIKNEIYNNLLSLPYSIKKILCETFYDLDTTPFNKIGNIKARRHW